MDEALLNQLGVAAAEWTPVRDGDGMIVDFRCVSATSLIDATVFKDRDTFVGQQLLEVFPTLRESAVFKLFVDAVENGQSGLVMNRRGDAPAFGDNVYRFSARPSAHGCFATFQDITAITRQVEADALARAEETARIKSAFLANMSHEIRTPLNGVLGMAQALRKSDLSETQTEQLDVILNSGSRLTTLLNDILDLSKIEAGHVEISPSEANVRKALELIMRAHEEAASDKGVDLRLVVDPSVPARLVFDRGRLGQCLDNLVSNALKFTHDGEVMVVATCPPAQAGACTLMVHVTDTGTGIPADKLDGVFNLFSQVDPTPADEHASAGLGLTITRRLARLMGGDVSVVSEPGHGSIFTLCIETERPAAESALSRTPPTTRQLPRTSSLAGRRILIVDDNDINRHVARTFLQDYDVETSEAEDGRDALSRMEKIAFDLVLMDIDMPRMDGATALRMIQASPETYGAPPVIALTAHGVIGDQEKYLGMGFSSYVAKPIDERALIGEIVHMIGETAPDLSATG